METQKHFSLVGCVGLALVIANGCGNQHPASRVSSGNRAADPNSSVTVTIPAGATRMASTAFGSNPLKVTPGTVVTWVNEDALPHSATSDQGVWDSKPIAPGESYSYTFHRPGIYRYHSSEDSSQPMSGTVEVGNDDEGRPSIHPTPNPTQTIIPEPMNPHHCGFGDRDDCDGQQQQEKPHPKPTKPTPKPTPTNPVYGPGSGMGPR